MYQPQPKKMLALQILDVLRKHSDQDHRLTQQDIARLLEQEHRVRADRGTISRNLFDLVDYGLNLEWTEIRRKGPDGQDNTICTDWYIEGLFDHSQLRLLIDSLFFSRAIPPKAQREMAAKLLTLSSRHFKAGLASLHSLEGRSLTNPQLFYTIDVLDEAIQTQRQVSFHYAKVSLNKQLTPRLNRSGEPREYLVNPYRMVVANGRHYLIGNNDRHRNVAHFRIDRITNIRLREERAKPMPEVEGLEQGLHLPRHMAEHLYMFSGESVEAAFVTAADMMDSVMDWFGMDARVEALPDDRIQVHVRVNRMAMRYWALQYARHVRLVSPADLVRDVRKDLLQALQQYEAVDAGAQESL